MQAWGKVVLLVVLAVAVELRPAAARDASLSMTRAAAEAGHPEAQYHLARMFEAGQGTPRDDHAAKTWYRRAAQREHVGAQYRLARMFERGWPITPERERRGSPGFVSPDRRQAVYWFKKAARNGHSDAQYRLGKMFEAGQGVKFNFPAAASWYRLAALGGNVDAQYRLASWLVAGLGVDRDWVRGCAWWSIAMDGGEPENAGALAGGEPQIVMDWQSPEAARASLERLKKAMTPQQIVEAAILAHKLTGELRPPIE